MDDSAENKILIAANETFLLLGFHGTTIAEIARTAGVNKTAIHYYFRSKERIYSIVLRKNLTLLLEFLKTKESWQYHELESPGSQANNKIVNIISIIWFIVNEIKVNNRLINELIKTDEETNRLIASIFNDSKNLEILEKLITIQFTEILNHDLKIFCLKGTDEI
eukprot:TRINITY_DN1299_c0_g1_i1.p3 TRINITY_DN1299_c0_g1~~TRINITY_DN1299_c0_g1_i1.p3  ORF type:complete len:165 (-),score=20.77 TRINITY_DN1299_c0_g1_i1:178-672(-)